MRNYNAMKAAKNLLSRATWRRAYVYEEDTAMAEESIAKVLRKAYNAGRRDEHGDNIFRLPPPLQIVDLDDGTPYSTTFKKI